MEALEADPAIQVQLEWLQSQLDIVIVSGTEFFGIFGDIGIWMRSW